MEEFISPLHYYDIIEINPGIGDFTYLFMKLFEKVTTFTFNSDLKFQIFSHNMNVLFNNTNIGSDKEQLITTIEDKKLYLNNVKDIDNVKIDDNTPIIFVNYIFENTPNILF